MNDARTDTENKENTEQRALFAASNSGKGFCSYYGDIFGEKTILRRYLIKGGPGTGKSSFMREIAQRAREAGYMVEYYRCSSDYTSLDAVVIDSKIALIDATAPHNVEPELVGARDELIDLGRFWNSDMLFDRRKDIERYSIAKSEAYTGAYRFLEGALAVDTRMREVGDSLLKRNKLENAVERLLRKIPAGEEYRLKIGICNSVGMKGRSRLDTYEQSARTIYAIEDSMRTGSAFLSLLATKARERKNAIKVSYDPISPSRIDAVLFEESKTAFVISDRSEMVKYSDKISGRINMKRFLQHCRGYCEEERRKKAEFRADKRIYESLIDSASECLSRAGEAHFALERIYGECMDFEGESRFCSSMAERICRELADLKA